MPTKVSARRRSRERVAWALAALATAAAVFLAVVHFRRSEHPAQLVRASIVLPEKTFIGDLALSPEGGKLAFTVANTAGASTLWVRDLDAGAAHPIAGSEGARFPFWSPDGRFVAFFADGKLKKVEAGGGALLAICDAENGVGGSWNREGTIVFGPLPTSGLFRVQASGGKPTPVTKLDCRPAREGPSISVLSSRRPALRLHGHQPRRRERRRGIQRHPVGLARRPGGSAARRRVLERPVRFGTPSVRARGNPGGAGLRSGPRGV